MRNCRRTLALLTLALPLAAVAEVPVLESSSMPQGGSSYPPSGYGTAGAYAGDGAQAPASAQGMLFNQLQQMQQEIAQLRGMLEEQQNEIQRLKQESLERYQDLDQRLSSGAGSAAPAQNSANGAINANGTPTPASTARSRSAIRATSSKLATRRPTCCLACSTT